MAAQPTAEFPERRRKEDNLLRSLIHQGLETIKFDDVRYTHELIGEGFWGEVFKITSGDNVMVLKTSKAGVSSGTIQGEQLTLNEVEIMRSLHHPNIVRFLGCCVTDKGQLYPLLEFINGGTLEDFLMNESIEIPWITRFTIASNISNGMKYLHNHNIMHRDLTSSNILLRIAEAADDVQVEALISDFGLAKDMKMKERTLSQVGSVDWMAPEVIMGKQYNKKADVFSYGIILCEMIGRCEADPETSVIRTISFEVDFDDFTVRSCEGCPPQFLDLAKACCQLDPENRPTFDRVYQTCSELIETYSNWDLNDNKNSLEKLNISGGTVDLSSTLTLEEVKPEPRPAKINCKDWDAEPRFSVVLDDIKMLEEDSVSLRSIKSNNLSLRIKDEPDRKASMSIINPIPSVNRNSGRIVLTIRNDARTTLDKPTKSNRRQSVTFTELIDKIPDMTLKESIKVKRAESPLEVRSPDITNPALLQELARLNEHDEMKALDELSVHSTLVLFDPGNNKMHKRRASGGKHSKVALPEVPFGRRQFSKKKKIRPVWKSVFNKNKSPKHDPAPKTTGLINFFKNLGSSKSSHNDSQQSGKSKISKGYSSEDKESGHVTRFAPPPASPKHKKHSSKNPPKPEILLPSYQEAQSQYNADKSSPKFDLTPTNSDHEPFFQHMSGGACACSCGQCRECMFRLGNVPLPGRPHALVARNESYRAMKPLPRTQSVPVEYDANVSVVSDNSNSSSNGGDSNKNRSRSFRDKLGFLPDKVKFPKS